MDTAFKTREGKPSGQPERDTVGRRTYLRILESPLAVDRPPFSKNGQAGHAERWPGVALYLYDVRRSDHDFLLLERVFEKNSILPPPLNIELVNHDLQRDDAVVGALASIVP